MVARDRSYTEVTRPANSVSSMTVAVQTQSSNSRFAALSRGYWRVIFEILFIVPAYTAYQFVRGNVGGDAGAAFNNATRLIDVERELGIFREPFLQQLILPKAWMVDLWNYVYIYGHLPVIIA